VAKSNSTRSARAADGNVVSRYLKETRGELRKVTWPTRQESQRLTVIVLAVTAIMAIFLGVLDFGFSNLIQGLVSLLGVI